MGYKFLELASTPAVKAAQEANGSLATWERFAGDRAFDAFTDAETQFISERDSFYMATVSESGWPYVQHRGGPPGFVRVLDETTLAFPDFRGNRQYVSLGNATANDRVSLIFMDHAERRRLKLFAHLEVRNLDADLALTERLCLPGSKARIERAMVLHLETFDWNCPQHITPRFTVAEMQPALAHLQTLNAELTAENSRLRAQVAARAST